mgnify:CR=1 FL=1
MVFHGMSEENEMEIDQYGEVMKNIKKEREREREREKSNVSHVLYGPYSYLCDLVIYLPIRLMLTLPSRSSDLI